MSKFRIFITLISLTVVTACSSDIQNVQLIKETNQKEEMISSYKAGVDLLNVGDYFGEKSLLMHHRNAVCQSYALPYQALGTASLAFSLIL